MSTGRPCSACSHDQREEIDSALVSGMALRPISERFGISTSSLFRHRSGHLPVALAKAQEAAEIAHGDSLLEQIRSIQQTTIRLLTKAEAAGAFVPAAMFIKEARGNLELLAKMLGELDERPVVNIATNPQWLTIQAVIMNDLADDPERRVRLATKLAELAG